MSRPRLTPRQIAALRYLSFDCGDFHNWWTVGYAMKLAGFERCNANVVLRQLMSRGMARRSNQSKLRYAITENGLTWLREHDKT